MISKDMQYNLFETITYKKDLNMYVSMKQITQSIFTAGLAFILGVQNSTRCILEHEVVK